MNIDIQNPGAPQENDLYMGDEYLFDMSAGIDPHESHSYETDTSIGQSILQQPGPSGPPSCISPMFAFQHALEEPGTELQDSGEDESEGGDVVTFEPDIEPGTLVVEPGYHIENPLLHNVEAACKLDQMRRIDDLGYSMPDSLDPC